MYSLVGRFARGKKGATRERPLALRLIYEGYKLVRFFFADSQDAFETLRKAAYRLNPALDKQCKRLTQGAKRPSITNLERDALFLALVIDATDDLAAEKVRAKSMVFSRSDCLRLFFLHVIRASRNISHLLAVAVTRIIHVYDTNFTIRLYEGILSGSEREDSSYRKIKKNLMRSISLRFENRLVEVTVDGEKRFEGRPPSEDEIDLTYRTLDKLTVWGAQYEVPAYFSELLRELNDLRKDASPDEVDVFDRRRMEALSRPINFTRLVAGMVGTEPAREKLWVPAICDHDGPEPRSRAESDHEELPMPDKRLLREIANIPAEQAALRERWAGGPIEVHVDGKLLETIYPGKKCKVRGPHSSLISTLEIWGGRGNSRVLLGYGSINTIDDDAHDLKMEFALAKHGKVNISATVDESADGPVFVFQLDYCVAAAAAAVAGFNNEYIIPIDARRKSILTSAFAVGSKYKKPIGRVIAACLVLSLASAVVSALFNFNPSLLRLTSDSGLTRDPSISPDGQFIAYASDRGGRATLDIWVESVPSAIRKRVTNGKDNNYDPSIANGWLAFRSDRQRGGVYKARVTGGAEELVVPYGYGPRVSPDGRWIAYWTGSPFDELGAVSIVRVDGGASINICPACVSARYPVWAVDSRSLLFRGAVRQPDGQAGLIDWWVVRIGSGEGAIGAPIQTKARILLDQQSFHSQTAMPAPEAWRSGDIIFTPGTHPSNAWKISLDSHTFLASGHPVPLTFSTSDVTHISMAASGDMYFSSLDTSANVVALPIDTSGQVMGPPVQLTSDSALDVYPSVSRDGLKLAFSSDRGRSRAVWELDLATGQYRQAARSSSDFDSPKISPDGSRVVYATTDLKKRFWTLKVVPSGFEATPAILSGVGNTGPPKAWSNDGERILVEDKTDPGYASGGGILDIKTSRYCTSKTPGSLLIPNSFSPDDKWVSFHTRDKQVRTLWVAGLRNGCWPDPSEWIRAVAEPSDSDREGQWSLDGNILYFLSERDGFRCIWAQRLDPLTKHPVGTTFAVQHYHTSGISLLNEEGPGAVGLTVSPQRLVFSVKTIRGNIWVAHLPKSGFSRWFRIN